MSPDFSAALQAFQLRSVSEAVGPLPGVAPKWRTESSGRRTVSEP
jgi:hypothetical protein